MSHKRSIATPLLQSHGLTILYAKQRIIQRPTAKIAWSAKSLHQIEHMLGKGPLSSTHKSCQQFSCTQEWKSASELRIPKAAVKMAVDDRCNAEVLEERSILRSLYAEHAKIVSKMRQRRLDVSLAMRGRLDSSLQKYSSALVGRKSRNHEKRKKGKAGARDSRRLHHTIQPLLLMTEAELQENELENMQLEDAESAHLAR